MGRTTNARRWRTTARRIVALSAVAATVTAGCARFDESASTPFTPEPSAAPARIDPAQPEAPGSTSSPEVPAPTGPCIDPDPNVVATCLDTLAGIVVLPGGDGALVAERTTGRIMRVTPQQPSVEIARIPVDATGDGGLLDLALSPTYGEDRLLYAYVSTASDNRVVRIAPGDVPKPVLTGIPRGATSNRGALDFAGSTLMVLTGDAGDPAAAGNPSSLAGKLLRIADVGTTATGQPTPQVILSGIGRAGDICFDDKGSTWVTDANATEDRLQRVSAEGAVVSPVWTWPDRPGVAGCAVGPGVVAISLTERRAVAMLPVDQQTDAVTAPPNLAVQDQYGALMGAAPAPDGQIWVTTANKSLGTPTATDDRTVKIPFSGGGGSTL